MEFFRATVMPSKKLFRQAGDAFVHKNKSLKVLFIIGMVMCLVLAPVLTYISYTTHINKLYISPVGIIFIAYYFFGPSYLGNALFKSQSKKNLNKETLYTFHENEFRLSTVDSNIVHNYSVIEELYETNDLICLYVNKSAAYIIPKDSITNPLCDVRAFLEAKVGKKFVFVKKKSTGAAIAKFIAVIIVSVVLSLFASGVSNVMMDKPQTFSYGEYSITLDKHFYESDEIEGVDYSLISSDATMTVNCYTQEEVDDSLGKENATLEDATKNYCEDSIIKNAKKVNHYTYNVEFYDTYDDVDYYNLVSVQQIDSEYWITHIYCEKYMEEEYAEKFEKWISSIQNKTNKA